MALYFGILTVSDTCYTDASCDKSGPKLEELISSKYPTAKIIFKKIVPDEQIMIKDVLLEWCSHEQCHVILTTGGTGFSPRDVTPEATNAVIERETAGITNAMLVKSLNVTSNAMLSRAVSGIRGKTLIVNMPGSAKAVTECFAFIADVIPHAVALIRNDLQKVKTLHCKIQGVSGVLGEAIPGFTPSKVKINVANRSRQSLFNMYEVEQALRLIAASLNPVACTEYVDIDKAFGRVLAEDVVSSDPLPPFPASIKDGYAVRSADTNPNRIVRGGVAAGDSNDDRGALGENECIRISTGAAVPAGADAVVQVEDTELVRASGDGSMELEIKIKVPAKSGQDIRPIGCDIPINSIILTSGDTIDVGHIGVLAAVGKTRVKVYSRPCIGIVSTGNELQDPKEKLLPGHIRDSNKLTLINLFKKYHYEAHDCGIVKDDPNSVKMGLESALLAHDIVITTGGVSMGEYDLVKRVLVEDFEGSIHFGRVNMKPGKPTTYATCVYDGKHKKIFGLPGNPVSATVTAILFVFPALKQWEHRKNEICPIISPIVIKDYKNSDIRPEFARAKLERIGTDFVATVTGNQISSRLNSFVGANSLVFIPSIKCNAQKESYAILLDPVGN